jgi:uncharacterized protein (TIGR01244 family)
MRFAMTRIRRFAAFCLLFMMMSGIAACASMRGTVRGSAELVVVEKARPVLAATPSGVALNAAKPGLYTAGQPAVADWAVLADAGVRTVVNLRTVAEMKGRDERAEVAAAGMRYVEIPVDGAGGISVENARRLSDAIAAASGDVLVHCASANRAGGLLAVAMAQQGMPAEEALALGRSAGMKTTETRVREVIGQVQAEICAAAPAQGADAAQRCPAGP